jgi:hypothetical protein
MKAVPESVRALLDLYATSLSHVRFADVDGGALARCAAEVEEAAGSVVTAQLAFDAAQAELRDKQDKLLQMAQRAFAYARVYAEADEGLSKQLEGVSLPRPARGGEGSLVLSSVLQPAPRRRGRPRKALVDEPTLDVGAPPSE